MKRLYASGEMSRAQLARRYQVADTTVRYHTSDSHRKYCLDRAHEDYAKKPLNKKGPRFLLANAIMIEAIERWLGAALTPFSDVQQNPNGSGGQ